MKLIKIAKRLIRVANIHVAMRRLISFSYRKRHALKKRIIGEIYKLGFATLERRHRTSTDSSRKYLEISEHLEEAIGHALHLDLLNGKPLRVLDIGCGAAYFLFVLKEFGHDVIGLDLSDTPLYNDMVNLLGIKRITHRIEAKKGLPNLGEPFDIITAFSICFDNHSTSDVWGTNEWKGFLDECRSRLLPGGRIFLNFNPATAQEFDFIPDEVAEMLRTLPGGRLSSTKETFLLTLP